MFKIYQVEIRVTDFSTFSCLEEWKLTLTFCIKAAFFFICERKHVVGRGDVPRWQKLTAEDFVDTVLSDTDDEVDLTEQAVSVSNFCSQSIPARNFYFTVSCSHSHLSESLDENN